MILIREGTFPIFPGFLALHPGLVSSLVVSVCLNNQGLWRGLYDLLSSRQCQVPAGCLPHSDLLAPTFHLREPLGTQEGRPGNDFS